MLGKDGDLRKMIMIVPIIWIKNTIGLNILKNIFFKQIYMTKYIILENIDIRQYSVLAIYTNIQDAYKAFFNKHVEKVLEINKYCNFNTNFLLVEIDDVVQAIEQTWKIIINYNDDLLLNKYNDYLDEESCEKYRIFLEQSKEYKKNLLRILF